MSKPLAEKLRPKDLKEFVGQSHLLSPGEVLNEVYESGQIHSMIFWGPPGTGKTTLAKLLVARTPYQFVELSAVSAGVKEVRQVIDLGRKAGTVVLFLDEIHRFSKSQQDALLGAVESGTIVLIGATTENPSFEVNAALLSRCQVYILNDFSAGELKLIADAAVANVNENDSVRITVKEYDALLRFSSGDARKLINIVEVLSNNAKGDIEVTNKLIEQILKRNFSRYDKSGEQHYDIISAFIKSMRGSDPNATLYWLARMIRGGEDPKFIARRMLILASEDIGNANPTALVLANSCFQSVAVIGYPECRIILSQTALYLANSVKSNAAYTGIDTAMALAAKTDNAQVPLHLRNAPTKLMKDLDYGVDYKYAHQYEGGFVDLEFLPESLSGTVLYKPGDNARENEVRKRMKSLWRDKYNY